MASAAALIEIREGWNKWHLGLVVGVGALGFAGLLYYMKRRKANELRDIVDSNQNASLKSPLKPKPQAPKDIALESKKEGNIFFKNGQYSAAIRCYTEAIKMCPTETSTDAENAATFYQNRAAAYEKLEDLDNIISDCNRAIKLNSKYGKALIRRARAHEKKQNWSQSLEDVTAGVMLEEYRNKETLLIADRILKEVGKSMAKEAFGKHTPLLPSKFFLRNYFSGFTQDPVFSSFSVGKVEPVKQVVVEEEEEEDNHQNDAGEEVQVQEGVVNGEVEEVKVHSPYEQALQGVGREEYDELIKLCTEELDLTDTPHRAEALLMRATMYIMWGQATNGRTDFETLLTIPNVNVKTRVNSLIKLGCLKLQAEETEAGIKCFKEAQDEDQDNADIYFHRATQMLLLQKFEECFDDFGKAVALAPNFPTPDVQLAYAEYQVALRANNPELMMAAEEHWKRLLLKYPKCSDLYMLYAQTRMDQGDVNSAKDLFVKAEELEPDNVNIIVHRGLLCLQSTQNIDETMKILNHAIKVDPLCEYAHEVLANMQLQRGETDAAEKSFQRAISLSKSEVEMSHLFAMHQAASIQIRVAAKMGIEIPMPMG